MKTFWSGRPSLACALLVACSSNEPSQGSAANTTDAASTSGSGTTQSSAASATTTAGNSGSSTAVTGTTGAANTSAVATGITASTGTNGTGGAGGASAVTGAENTTSAGGSTTGSAVPSGEAFSVDYELASDVDPNAPGTVGIVTWSIADVAVESAAIEFGLDTSYGMSAPVDLAAAEFRTLLLGMKPDRTYHFRISVVSGGMTYVSDDYTIDTGPPTNAVAIGDFTIQRPEAYERGFMIVSYWQGQNSSIAFVLDADGEIVWWYDFGTQGIARARISADGKNMWMITPNNQGGPLRRVSMDTLDSETYSGTVGSHDLTPVSGATMAYLEYGESDCDSIFEIDPSGTTSEVFESDDVLTGAMCHANALRYSRTEDVYVLTDVSQDVLVINRDGSVEWRLSELLPGGMQTHGGRQHGQHLLDESILVFANAGAGQNASTAVEYDLTTGEEIWNYDSGFFTANLGDVQRLPGGNTLVTYSNDSVVHQVDPEKNLVLEFDGRGANIGYVLWTPSLYEPGPDLDL